MRFFAIRYFVVETAPTLFPLEKEIRPKDLFTIPISNGFEFIYYNRRYTNRVLNDELTDRFWIGYFLKSVETHLIKVQDEEIDESDIPNWEKLFFVIDTVAQVMIIEHDQSIATSENIKNVLERLTNRFAGNRGYEVKLEFLVDKFAFWKIIQESSGIYQIAFQLNAPNLFGASKSANEWLKTLKEKHNMSRVGVDFRNDNARLTYDPDELESYRDYADSGGGNWTLGVLQGSRKRRYQSFNHLRRKEFDITTTDPKYVKRNFRELIQRLQQVIETFVDE